MSIIIINESSVVKKDKTEEYERERGGYLKQRERGEGVSKPQRERGVSKPYREKGGGGGVSKP